VSDGTSPSVEEARDQFKRSTAATIKAISKREDLEVVFSQGPASIIGNEIRLPAPSMQVAEPEKVQIRGLADGIALKLRYHNDHLHTRHRPTDQEARKVWDQVEQARVEALGIRHLAGVEANIANALDQKYALEGLDRAISKDDLPLSEAMRLIAREVFSGLAPPPSASHALSFWRHDILQLAGPVLDQLKHLVDDEPAFIQSLTKLMVNLELVAPEELLPTDSLDTNPDDSDDQANPEGDDGQDDSQGSGGQSDDGSMEQRDQAGGGGDGSGDQEDSPETGDDSLYAGQGADEAGGPQARHHNKFAPKSNDPEPRYHAYTSQFDQVVLAQDLCDAEELTRLRSLLDQQLVNLQGVVAKLANRLQRKLMAQQLRSWEFDLEEGILDAGRLSRIVTNPTQSLSFKMEHETDFRDTVVTLLIDNSGSMRGRPISVAALSADILARTLERCGVKVEILGFTTVAWKGGKTRELWQNGGKPANPGRLNDLRHIIYKPADVPWRRCRTALGLMLREGVLKENIDGEALLWAHQRLMARPEQRRILLVISDGAPVDDSTLSTNPGNYLEKHLRDVIEWIESRSPVQLIAIGIGHDVTRYYARAVTISDAEELGGAVMRQLTSLFDDQS
jgi:cobaltochelatase CobT